MMQNLQIFATPWWVNLAILVPIGSYVVWRKKGLLFSWEQLLYSGLFGIAFGFNEAVVVVYLRAATGLLSPSSTLYQQVQLLANLPHLFVLTETGREIATLVILISVSLLASKERGDRWALFLWMFAFWDIFYYVGLWLTIQWPYSLLTQDILFLVPTPWVSQVWFPILVSALVITALLLTRKSHSVVSAAK